jgi:nucleoside-triphosphatase THEP1
MDYAENKCILWVGDKHAGKTTAAAELVRRLQQEGYTAGGILAPSIYQDDQLVGFDIVDIKNDVRVQLAIRDEKSSGIVPYEYNKEGLEFGHAAISPVGNEAADLVIVDEYGPWNWTVRGGEMMWTGCLSKVVDGCF